jgi:osmotically-inducible protein OsmY
VAPCCMVRARDRKTWLPVRRGMQTAGPAPQAAWVAIPRVAASGPYVAPAARPGASAEGDYRDDVKLATAANNALAQDVTVPDNMEATAEDGNIILTRTVSCGTERAAAEAVVAGLIGARNVRNDIDIAHAADPVDVDLNVREALDRSALVPDGSDAGADTKDNIITLTGQVRTWADTTRSSTPRRWPSGHRHPRQRASHWLTAVDGRRLHGAAVCGAAANRGSTR